jgi:hypothetical protein
MRRAHAALLVAAVACCILVTVANARKPWTPPESKQVRFDFRTRGSAKSDLGASKLARIHSRSKQRGIQTVDELADQLEREEDLVSCFGRMET